MSSYIFWLWCIWKSLLSVYDNTVVYLIISIMLHNFNPSFCTIRCKIGAINTSRLNCYTCFCSLSKTIFYDYFCYFITSPNICCILVVMVFLLWEGILFTEVFFSLTFSLFPDHGDKHENPITTPKKSKVGNVTKSFVSVNERVQYVALINPTKMKYFKNFKYNFTESC